jgi:hypothetical protein
VIHIEDVAPFYKVYDAAGTRLPSTFSRTTSIRLNALQELAKLRNVSGTTIAEELNRRPEIYSDAKRCIAVLRQVRQRLEVAFDKLGSAVS